MKPGTKVKMGSHFKQALMANNCYEHIQEFGNCVGIVDGLADYGDEKGPEVDVRWQPSNLRYSYHPDELEVQLDCCLICEEMITPSSGLCTVEFGYGSRYDQLGCGGDNMIDKLLACSIVEAYICDDCFEKKAHLFNGFDVTVKSEKTRVV